MVFERCIFFVCGKHTMGKFNNALLYCLTDYFPVAKIFKKFSHLVLSLPPDFDALCEGFPFLLSSQFRSTIFFRETPFPLRKVLSRNRSKEQGNKLQILQSIKIFKQRKSTDR